MGSQQSHPDESTSQDTSNTNPRAAGDIVVDAALIESPSSTTEDRDRGDDQTEEEAPVSPSTSNPHRPLSLDLLRLATSHRSGEAHDIFHSSPRLLAMATDAIIATDMMPPPVDARGTLVVESQPNTAQDVPRYADDPRSAFLLACARVWNLARSPENGPFDIILRAKPDLIWPTNSANGDNDDDQDMPFLTYLKHGAHFEDPARFYAPRRTIYTSTQTIEDISASMNLVTLRPSTTPCGNSGNNVDSAEVTNPKHVVARTEALCGLCLDTLTHRVYITSCGHGRCVGCVIEWLKCSDTCQGSTLGSHEGSTLVEVDEKEDRGESGGNGDGRAEHDGEYVGSDQEEAGEDHDAA
ncbi:hypothetical protein TI39_contig426g00009 [Zymoseptoria brevis]|uniref:RING-type domain-containing protein n=1 Tax=Zymoseptoria brevis TaxID=1047168 RepID=A0A0F4GMD9_9PEZI|nr:hypothetical protein TI39_contig426g00009 [Zymoseptoria brevis]